MDEVNNELKSASEEVSRFRRILSQFIACTAKNLLIVDLGLIVALPTVLIAAMTGISNEHNRNEYLSLTPVQTSWIGSIGYLFQPLGSILSVFMTDPLGRKRSMILVNIPIVFGWLLLYNGDAIWKVFTGCAFLGLAIGLMEAPLITYLGEICEPSTRGVLVSLSSISVTLGSFLGLFLNTLMPWRTIALVCLTCPIITAIAICFIPETPQWLMSKNRQDEAKKSLCWLRGWVPYKLVAEEFNSLQKHSEHSKSCYSCHKQDLKCTHTPTLAEKFTELKRKRTLKPFFITLFMFFIAQFSGVYSMRPFVVQIFRAYDSPLPLDQAAAVMSFLDNLGTISFMCLIRFTGKRPIYLTTSLGAFFCSATLCLYGFFLLPKGYISFDQTHEPHHVENTTLTYIPLICLILWSLFSYCGFISMPWLLVSEIFPFKSRGVACGVVTALNYVLGFVSRKTYYNLETTLSLPGISLFYCVICGLAFIVTYFILPETEGFSLEDIELHFSDSSKTITDRKILKSSEKMSLKNVESSDKKTESIENGG